MHGGETTQYRTFINVHYNLLGLLSQPKIRCTYYVLYFNSNDGEVEKSVNESISVVRLLREAMKIGINKQILKNIEYEI